MTSRSTTWLLLLPALLALAVVGTAWLLNRRPGNTPLGPVAWNFTDSWASNLTVLLAGYQLLIGMELLPPTGTLLTKSTYALLAVLFAGLVAAAPLAFLAVGTPAYDATGKLVIHGRVSGLALSAFLVMWAVLGQVTVAGTHGYELMVGSDLPRSLIATFLGLTFLLLVLAFVHGCKSILLIFGELKRPSAVRTGNIQWVLP